MTDPTNSIGATQPLTTGTLIGPYEIISYIARGGMGLVYRARHRTLHEDVALKLLYPHLTGNPEFTTRFQREGQAMAKLRHPHIAQVFNADVIDGHHFLVMEFASRGTVQQLIVREKQLPDEQSLLIARQMAQALAFAHSKRIVHRDVKPSNMLWVEEKVRDRFQSAGEMAEAINRVAATSPKPQSRRGTPVALLGLGGVVLTSVVAAGFMLVNGSTGPVIAATATATITNTITPRPTTIKATSTLEPPAIPVTPSPTPVTPSPTPVTPSPTPVTPSATPVTPSATPAAPSPTPATPSPTPATPSPTPVTPSPTPVTPSPTSVTPSLTPTTPSPTPTATRTATRRPAIRVTARPGRTATAQPIVVIQPTSGNVAQPTTPPVYQPEPQPQPQPQPQPAPPTAAPAEPPAQPIPTPAP